METSRKDQMARAIASLPDDADFEDGMDALYLLAKVEEGLKQIERGETISHEEMRARIQRWLA
jgi:predicted transcriptional regulator